MNGILFKSWKHQLIRENPDREWQTRRLDGLKEISKCPDQWKWIGHDQTGRFSFRFGITEGEVFNIHPRYHVDEVVYIKEMWTQCEYPNPSQPIHYKLDNNKAFNEKWHSSLFMPAWAARYFIKITNVRAERIKNMTENDAHKEGVDNLVTFMLLWDSINKKGGYGWETNCWVWIYEFQKVST